MKNVFCAAGRLSIVVLLILPLLPMPSAASLIHDLSIETVDVLPDDPMGVSLHGQATINETTGFASAFITGTAFGTAIELCTEVVVCSNPTVIQVTAQGDGNYHWELFAQNINLFDLSGAPLVEVSLGRLDYLQDLQGGTPDEWTPLQVVGGATRVLLTANAVHDTLPVPEPGTLVLISLGLAGLGWSRRKKVV